MKDLAFINDSIFVNLPHKGAALTEIAHLNVDPISLVEKVEGNVEATTFEFEVFDLVSLLVGDFHRRGLDLIEWTFTIDDVHKVVEDIFKPFIYFVGDCFSDHFVADLGDQKPVVDESKLHGCHVDFIYLHSSKVSQVSFVQVFQDQFRRPGQVRSELSYSQFFRH